MKILITKKRLAAMTLEQQLILLRTERLQYAKFLSQNSEFQEVRNLASALAATRAKSGNIWTLFF